MQEERRESVDVRVRYVQKSGDEWCDRVCDRMRLNAPTHTVDPPVPEIHTLISPSYICKFMPLLVSTSTEYNTWKE
jgi:hypothetical protein